MSSNFSDRQVKWFDVLMQRLRSLKTAAGQTDIPVVSLNDRICPGDTCPPVIDGVLVWRDSHHVSATFADALGETLSRRVEDAVRLHSAAAGGE